MGSPGPHPARAPKPLAASGHWAACPEQSPFPTLGRPDFQCPAFRVGRPALGDPAVPLSRCFQDAPLPGEEDASLLSPWGSKESSGPGGGDGQGRGGHLSLGLGWRQAPVVLQLHFRLFRLSAGGGALPCLVLAVGVVLGPLWVLGSLPGLPSPVLLKAQWPWGLVWICRAACGEEGACAGVPRWTSHWAVVPWPLLCLGLRVRQMGLC